MAAPCGASILVCALRATLLDSTGFPADSPDNYVVTDAAMSVAITPTYAQGADVELNGGCDCIIASYRGVDKFKRWEIEIPTGKLVPVVEQMLLDGTLITGSDGSDTVPIGVVYPGPLDCGTDQAAVQVEFWTKHINDDEQDVTFPWIHHVYPNARFTKSQQTYQAGEFAQPTLTGFTRKNTEWGDGPYGDGPGVDMPFGGWFYTAIDPPAASCAYQDVTPAS